MANGGRIDYTIGFKTDKAGLNELKTQLNELSRITATDILNLKPNLNMNQARSEMMKLREAVSEVETAMNSAFDTELGVLNIQKLQTNLKRLNLTEIQQRFSSAGATGQKAFLNISKAALTTNVQLKQTSKILDKMGETLVNTIKWNISSKAINSFTGAIQQAYGYVQHLDSSLNDIRIVTNKSAEDMAEFAVQANKAAKTLGQSTTNYTEASLIYYQQGLSDEEVAARAETTLKAANVTGQSASQVSEELTAVWNGFQIQAENTEAAVDKLAAVAATTASDLEELSVGMSKVASTANAMGVDIDQLNAQISTIISVTRQAPESVGTALKTIYARMGDLKLGGEDEFGIKLGDVSGTLDKVGISVLDTNGNLREMGDVIEDVAAKWSTWTEAQQIAIAEVMAGKRQYNNLIALFDNWDKYTSALETSKNATGTLQHQQDIYMESTEAHLQQLKTQWEDLYDSILDPEAINTVADGLNKILTLITRIVDSLGGGKTLLFGLISLITTKFSKQISSIFVPFISNMKAAQQNAAILQTILKNIDEQEKAGDFGSKAAQAMREKQTEFSKFWHLMSEEEINASNELVKELGYWADLKEEIEQSEQALLKYSTNRSQTLNKGTQGKTFFANSEGKEQVSQTTVNETKKQLLKDEENTVIKLKNAYSSLETTVLKYNKKSVEERKKDKKSIGELENSYKELKEAIGQASDLAKKDVGIFSEDQIDKANKTLKDLENRIEQLKNGKTRGGITSSLRKELQELLESFGLADERIKQFIDGLDKLPTESEKVKQGIITIEQATDTSLLAIQNRIQGISQLIGSFSGLAFSIQAFSNIGNIINDKDIETAEKFKQITGNLLIQLPMLINTIQSFSTAMSKLGATTLFLTEEQRTKILMDKTETAGILKKTAAYLGLKVAMLGILAAAAAVGIAIGVVTNKIKENKEAIRANNEAIIEQNEVLTEQTEKSKEAAEAIKELAKQYEENEISQEEYQKKKAELMDQLDEEAQKALILADSYKEVNRAIEEYLGRIGEANLKTAKNTMAAAGSNVLQDMEKGGGIFHEDQTWSDLITLSAISTSNQNLNEEIAKKLEEAGLGYIHDIAEGEFTLYFDATDPDLANKLIEFEKIMKEYSYVDTHFTKELNENLKQMQASSSYAKMMEAYDQQSQAELDISASEVGLSLADTDNAEEIYQNFIDNIKEKQEQGIIDSSKNAEELANSYISAMDNVPLQVERDIRNTAGIIESFLELPPDELMKNWEESGVGVPDWVQQKKNKAEEASRYLNDNAKIDYINLFTEEDWDYILGADSIPQAIDSVLEAHGAEIEDSLKENIFSKISDTSNQFEQIFSQGITGELDVNSDEYKEILTQLESIKEVYPELTNEIEIFTNEGLIGTEHWIQASYKLQEAIDNLEFQSLNDNFKSAKDNLDNLFTDYRTEGSGDHQYQVPIEVTPDDAEFQDAMDDILNADYAINVEIHSDAERDFNQLVESLEDADKMVEKIGDDFIVAADDIRELNNTFPGILEGIEYLGDGTIQLNKDIAESAIAAARNEEAASTEATITKLENSANELRGKAEVYDAMAEVAEKANKGIVDSDTAKTEISNKLNSIEAENDKIATDNELSNAALVADNSNENARVTAENWSKAYQEATRNSAEFAKAAVRNAQTAANGKGKIVTGGDFGVRYKGSNGVASEAKQVGQFKTTDDGSIDWGSTAQLYRDTAEGLRNKANDIEGMIVAAGAKAVESINKGSETGKGKNSGSSGSGKDADQEEYENYQIDIYHKVNAELEDIEEKLGRIQTIGDHTWGKSQVDVLNQEKELLDENIDKLEEKIDLQKKDLSVRKKQLENEGFTFSDDSAVILNREEQIKALWDGYDAMVAQYNAMSADAQESYKATLEAEKDRVQQIADALDKYEDVYGEYQNALDDWLDKQYEIIETQIEAFNAEVEVKLTLNQAERDWIDFKKEVLDDIDDLDFGGRIAASLATLGTLLGPSGEISMMMDHLNESVYEIGESMQGIETNFTHDGVFDTAAAKEQLEDYRDKLMEAVRTAKEQVDEVADTYLDALDDANDKIQKQIEGWENIGDQIEHDINLIKKISGEKSYAALDRLYKQQHENNLETIQADKDAADFWAKRIEIEKKALETAEEGSVEWKTHNEALEEASENYKSAIQTLNSTVMDALDNLEEWQNNQMAAIEQQLDQAFSGGIGLDQLEKEWNLVNDVANRYLDNVERAIEMDDLDTLFDKALNQANLTVSAQEEINKLRDEEFSKLEDREKISQYDIDLAKSRLAILQQQIALEDAQKNKSNLRLRRDSQGNYTYQYTGDDSQIDDAENGLMSAKKDWYELVKNRNLDLRNEIIKNRQDLSKAIMELNNTDWTNNEEGRKKQLEIIALYEQKEKDLMWDTQNTTRDFFEGTAKYFEEVENRDILPQWETTVNQLVNNWRGEGEKSFTGAVTLGIQEIESTQDEFVRKTQDVLNTAGISYINLYTNGIDPTKTKLEGLVSKNEDFEQGLDETNSKLDDYADKLKDVEQGYKDLEEAASSAIQSANRMLEQLANTAVDAVNQINNAINSANSAAAFRGYSSHSPSYSNTGGTTSSNQRSAGMTTSSKRFRINLDYQGATGIVAVYDTMATGKNANKPVFVTGDSNRPSESGTEANLASEKIKKKGYDSNNVINWPKGWRTGGYTGTWPGSSLADDYKAGRLALLHQKELVLNETDTKNILNAVAAIRDIDMNKYSSGILDTVVSQISSLLNTTSDLFNKVRTVENNTNTSNSYSGDVVINADFSGVKSADAIYEALVELENYGIQTMYTNI